MLCVVLQVQSHCFVFSELPTNRNSKLRIPDTNQLVLAQLDTLVHIHKGAQVSYFSVVCSLDEWAISLP